MEAQPLLGKPIDRLLAIYLVVAAFALAWPHRPGSWPILLALHGAALLLAWPPAAFARAADRAAAFAPRLTRFLLHWYPVLLIPALYTELAPLNRAIFDGFYFDDLIQRWELALFGGQPSRDLAAAAPHLWLSELLHAGYLSYYFVIYVPLFILFFGSRSDAFPKAAFTLMLAFFLHYLFFIYFPVQGPRYIFPAPGGALADGPLYQLTHRLLEAGSSQGAAFPSSHVGVSVAQTLTMLRFHRRLTPLLGVLTVLLAVGAVYGGFHYAIDAACGLLLGTVAVLVAPAAYRALGGRWSRA